MKACVGDMVTCDASESIIITKQTFSFVSRTCDDTTDQVAPCDGEITGLVEHPKTLTLDDLKAMPKHDQLMTLECSGNGASKGFMNAVYNSKWTGTLLAPILKACQLKPEAAAAPLKDTR